MKKLMLNVWRGIVGAEYGFTEEGNEQWYYFVSLVINLMLIWWLGPQSDALVFTILAVIHLVTICIFGYLMLDEEGVFYSYLYYATHLVLLIMALLTNFWWAVITTLITLLAVSMAPDCTGINYYIRDDEISSNNPKLLLIFNTIIFIAFVVVDFLLPIKLWIKLAIIAGMLLLHPLIDYLEGDCIIISDCTADSIDVIIESIKKLKNRK